MRKKVKGENQSNSSSVRDIFPNGSVIFNKKTANDLAETPVDETQEVQMNEVEIDDEIEKLDRSPPVFLAVR